MKLTLAQKGIFFVSIPLVIQLVFLGILGLLNTQAEQDSERAFHSGQISDSTNKLVHDLFEIMSLSQSDLIKGLSSDGSGGVVTRIRSDLDQLKLIVKGNPAQETIVQNSAHSTEAAYALVKQLRLSLTTDSLFLEGDTLNAIRTKLRSCLKQMVSQDLIDMGQSEKQKAQKSHESQMRERRRIKALLTAGVAFNIALTIILTLVFSKQIVSRLKILVDNSFRLASVQPLNPPLTGNDEIANVDHSFHDMAAALAEAKQKEKSLVEHSLDVICSFDKNGRFTTVNPAGYRVFGYSEAELLGMNLKTFLADEDINHFEKSISQALSGNAETKFEARIKHKDETLSELDWSVHWVPFEERFFCVGHDISERKEVERLKQRFMAMISHDLRTPLSVMKNYLEMTNIGLCGELNERGEHLLKVADRNATRMLSLINDLLDLEKSESGRLTLNRSAVELNEIMDQCVKSIASLALRQEVHLDLAATALTVFADPHRLSQVLINLVSNAIKFSPKGGTVKLWAEQKNDMAFVYVTDEGRGVPEHLKEVIFEHFHQVEVADAVDKGGSGLGLAICKVIVELHGGKVKVENNQDKGSIFSFNLPLMDQPELRDPTLQAEIS